MVRKWCPRSYLAAIVEVEEIPGIGIGMDSVNVPVIACLFPLAMNSGWSIEINVR